MLELSDHVSFVGLVELVLRPLHNGLLAQSRLVRRLPILQPLHFFVILRPVDLLVKLAKFRVRLVLLICEIFDPALAWPAQTHLFRNMLLLLLDVIVEVFLLELKVHHFLLALELAPCAQSCRCFLAVMVQGA